MQREINLQSLNLFRRFIIMRSSCCILFTISLLAISVADDPHDKVSEERNLTSLEFRATNKILRLERNSLETKMKRMENDLNEIKTGIRRITEIKANDRYELQELNRNCRPFSCSQSFEKYLIEVKASITDGQFKIIRVQNDLKDIKADISELNEMKSMVKYLLEVFDKNNLPSSCSEALKAGKPSGVYRIYIPHSDLEPFDVYCMEDPGKGPAWTVIQRRQDGSEDFYRDWESYKNGFGNLTGEFWIGLDKIHAMTSYQPNSLWIQLGDFKNETRFAKYEKFAITGERENYALSTLESYDGTAGDSLRPHLNMKFSTKDRDNDDFPNESCASTCQGAWWYRNCYLSNLNGPFGQNNAKGKSIAWHTWAYYYPLKYSHMAIRPIN